MRIDSVNIRRHYSGKYECDVTIDGDFQSVKLRLDESHTQAVIECVADLIVSASKEVAADLTRQALDYTALEDKSSGAA